MKAKLIVIIGPTGSGKTAAVIQLAQAQAAAIVSADSRQVYRGMDIGTAKQKDTGDIPQYLIDIRDPDEPLTLADWQQAAFNVIDDLVERGITPLLVGGTMLYVDSILFYYDIPQVAPDKELRAALEARPVQQLHAELIAKDPAVQTFIEPGNKRRIIRALEVIAKTGRPFSESRRKQKPKYDVQMLGLFPRQLGGQAGWEELERRLEARAREMLDNGLIEETQALIDRYGRELPLLQTLNYKQALELMAGQRTKKETIAEMTRVNLRYARRQMSWWKGRKEIRWFSDPAALVMAQLRPALLLFGFACHE